MSYHTRHRNVHSMDLRRIVEEVEARKNEELALLAPTKSKESGASGVAGSILFSVRERMLREDPTADVAAINEVIQPDRAITKAEPPATKVAAQSAAAAIAREGRKAERAPAKPTKAKDDFLSRYLLMSEEFERRFAAKGWTNLVRKKCSAGLRH